MAEGDPRKIISCGDCGYWVERPVFSGMTPHGVCRRHAPVPKIALYLDDIPAGHVHLADDVGHLGLR